MNSKNTIEDELNTVRIALYEETRGMTPEAEVAYLKALAAPIREKYGIRTVGEIREAEGKKTSA
jgi:hypothetical protein